MKDKQPHNISQKEYKVISVLLFLGAHIPTRVSEHFQKGDIITPSELKKFCRAHGLIYESNTANCSTNNKYIKALDFHMQVHLEAIV